MSHDRRSVPHDRDIPPPGGGVGDDAVLSPPQGLQQDGKAARGPSCSGGSSGSDGDGEGLGFRVRRHALEDDRLGACRSAATVGGMLAKRQKSAAEEQGQGAHARQELLQQLGRAGDELLVAQTLARSEASLVGSSGRGAGGAAAVERGLESRGAAAAVLGDITGVTVDAWRQTVVGRTSAAQPPPPGGLPGGAAAQRPEGVAFAVDCHGNCDGLPFTLDILLAPPARSSSAHPSGGAASGAAPRGRGGGGGGARMTLRAAHLAPSVPHPGGSPGAKGWFLESTSIQMPPESGGIRGRLT